MKYTTNTRIWVIAIGLVIMPLAVFAQPSQRDNPLGPAKALYESAEYEGALTALDEVAATVTTPGHVRDTALYRALCLLALNRRQDAASTIERIVMDDPLFRLVDDSMPPRLRTLVEDVRKRLAPTVAQQHYQAGKKFFDAGDYPSAKKEFSLVIQLLDELNVTDSALADVRILSTGFRDLAQRSIDAPKPAAPEPSVAPPVSASLEVVPPVAISQDVPDYPQKFISLLVTPVMEGVIEVLIGANGQVKEATLVKTIHPAYDQVLLAAAKQWRYQPALRDGKPVEFAKRITIVVRAR